MGKLLVWLLQIKYNNVGECAMKQVPIELLNYLHSRKQIFMCDLYELELASGLVFRYANYGMDITLPDGSFYTSKGPSFTRDKIGLSSKIKVDEMNVTITVDSTDKIGGVPMMHVANNGGFDCAKLTLSFCFMDSPGVVVGAVEMFGGDISINNGGGLDLSLKVKSSAQRLDVEYPPRRYYPTCPYTLYSAGCGLNIATFTVYGTVTSIIAGAYHFGTNLNFSSGYYNNGGIEFLSGALTGAFAPIKYSNNTGFELLIPLNIAPAVGDTFRVYPGCNKTSPECDSKFGNFTKNRSTPYIPLKESIV
jgi:uncharacterized phage protein (TIGR02218 family)